MPSPFPGMDPYLEAPALWQHVHTGLIYTLTAELNRRLPPGYAAVRETRVYLVDAEREVIPDVQVESRWSGSRSGSGAAQILEAPEAEATTWLVSLPSQEIREPYIEIRQVWGTPRVVTAVEVLSPSNKTSGSRGRGVYREKQEQLAKEGIALLEIDLLRAGEHTVAAPLEELQRLGTWDGLACLHRSHDGFNWQVWPLRLREPLPPVLVPLAGPDPELSLPLQPALNRLYDEGAFARLIDYQRDPDPSLNEADSAWARELLRRRLEGPEAVEENGSAP